MTVGTTNAKTSGFWREYKFLDLTLNAVKNAQEEIVKPDVTVGSFILQGGKTFGAVICDFSANPLNSGLRQFGFCLPLPPEPPAFPSAHNNVQFMKNSIERALWDWSSEKRVEMLEGISDGLLENRNVFQIVGEWSLLFSYDNRDKPNYYVPTYLRVSEPLANKESFSSIGDRFIRLKNKDKAEIRNTVYHQKEGIGQISEEGKKVYQDIRGLASLMTQGNEGFMASYKEYVQRAEETPAELPSSLAARTTPVPQTVLNVPRPVNPYPMIPLQRESQPYSYAQPSAPAFEPETVNDEAKILQDLNFMRTSFLQGIKWLAPQEKERISDLVKKDVVSGSSRGNPSPESSPKYLVARLALLHFFKTAFKERGSLSVPEFFWIRGLNESGKSIHEVGQTYASFDENQYVKIQQTILNPMLVVKLDQTMRKRLGELNEFAEILSKNQAFLNLYAKLQIDLVAQ
jgi:hypothetical protein